MLAYVLHELPADELPAVVRRLASTLRPQGRLVVVDHAPPGGVLGRAAWRGVLRLVEGDAVARWLAVSPPALLAAGGLRVNEDRAVAGGRARLTVGGA